MHRIKHRTKSAVTLIHALHIVYSIFGQKIRVCVLSQVSFHLSVMRMQTQTGRSHAWPQQYLLIDIDMTMLGHWEWLRGSWKMKLIFISTDSSYQFPQFFCVLIATLFIFTFLPIGNWISENVYWVYSNSFAKNT